MVGGGGDGGAADDAVVLNGAVGTMALFEGGVSGS